MSMSRFVAVVLIFGAVSLAWGVLGGAMFARTELLDSRLSDEMDSKWGPRELVQTAPYWAPRANSEPLGRRHGRPLG